MENKFSSNISTISCSSGSVYGELESILIVEQDCEILLSACEHLRKEGFTIFNASNGIDALSLAHKYRPNLVLLPTLIGEMDALKICEQILAIDNANISVLMIVEPDEKKSIERAFDLGASGFISKPVDIHLLNQQIRFHFRAVKKSIITQNKNEKLTNAQRIAKIGYWYWDSSIDELTLSTHLAQMINQPLSERKMTLNDYLLLIHEDDRSYIENIILAVQEGAEFSATDYRLITGNKSSFIAHQELGISSSNNNIIFGTIQDITVQRDNEQRTRELAYSDALTGLANRSSFYKYMETTIQISKQREQKFALLSIDLDGFKGINDSLGHKAGDELLKIVSTRLKGVLRNNDFIARLSGDEFCILLNDIEDRSISTEVAQRCLKDINESVFLESRDIKTCCSIGIVHFPEDGQDLQTLLKRADAAMYAAKQNGKHDFTYFYPELGELANERVYLEQELRLAINRNQFVLYYQPQVCLKTGKMIGVEALVRWNHPELGLVSPKRFIEVAERMGLIKDLGEWVLKAACDQANYWKTQGLPTLRMSVNISSLHFQDKSFLNSVINVLDQTGMDPEFLEIEITESIAQANGNNHQMIDLLRGLGIKIAIDDFGKGYSSLASLKHLSLDCIKIDRLFIKDMIENQEAIILLSTMVSLAHALGYLVIAKGVEQDEQVQILAAINCDVIQGFYFSRPVLPELIPNLALNNFSPEKIPLMTSLPNTTMQQEIK